jgi:hypothetical protein
MLETLDTKRVGRVAKQVRRVVKRLATAAERMRRNDIAAKVIERFRKSSKGFGSLNADNSGLW